MGDVTYDNLRYRLLEIAQEGTMPEKSKLDKLGIDVDPRTLPGWEEHIAQFDEAIEYTMNQIAFDAMWRTAQTIARAIADEQEGAENGTNL